MMYCDFKTVTNILFNHLVRSSIKSYCTFINMLFCSYNNARKTSKFSDSLTSKLGKGRRIPASSWVEYYKTNDSSVMLADIFIIMPLLINKEQLQKTLYHLYCDDEYLSEERRQSFGNRFTEKYTDDDTLADLLYEVLLIAIIRHYGKSDDGIFFHVVPYNEDNKEISASETDDSETALFSNSDYIPPCEYFCGRDEELNELHEIVHSKSGVIVVGEPGIGKSELVRKYIELYGSEYQHIGYYFYSKSDNSLKDIIAGVNGECPVSDRDTDCCYKKNIALLSSLGKNALLVIDSFNVAAYQDKQFLEVLRLKCDVIFISHSHYDDLCTYELGVFRDKEYAHHLIQNYYGYYRYDHDLKKCVVAKHSPPIDDSVYDYHFSEHRVENAMNYIILRSNNHPYMIDFFGKQLQKGLQTPLALEGLLTDILERHNGDLMKTRVSNHKDDDFFKGTYSEFVDNLYHFSELSKDEAYALSYMRFTNAPYKAINKRIYARLIELKDINVLESLVEKGYIRETVGGNITLTETVMNCVDSVISLDTEEYIAFADKFFSRNNAFLPEDLRVHIAYLLTGNYIEYYCKTPFMALHIRFRYMYKIDDRKAMVNCLYGLATLYRQRKCTSEEKGLYWEDKKILMDNLPEGGLSADEQYHIDHGDGTELPLWKYKYPKRVYEDDS